MFLFPVTGAAAGSRPTYLGEERQDKGRARPGLATNPGLHQEFHSLITNVKECELRDSEYD